MECILTSSVLPPVQRQDSPGALDRCMAHLDANVAWYHGHMLHILLYQAKVYLYILYPMTVIEYNMFNT